MASVQTGSVYILTNGYIGASQALTSSQDKGGLSMASTDEDSRQQWYLSDTILPGFYRFHTLDTGDNIALDVINDNGVNSINLHLATVGEYTGQYWRLDLWYDGTIRLSNNFTGPDKHLDIYSDTLSLFLGDGDHTGQHWTFGNVVSQSSSSSTPPPTASVPVPINTSTSTSIPTPTSTSSSLTSSTSTTSTTIPTSTATTTSSGPSQNSPCTSQDAPQLCGSICIASESICCPDKSSCPTNYYCSPIAGVAPAEYGCCPVGQTCALNATESITASQAQPPATSVPASSNNSQEGSANRTTTLSAGAIAGIVIGVVAIVLGIIAVVLFFRRRARRRTPKSMQQTTYTPSHDQMVPPNMQEPYEIGTAIRPPSYPGAELHGSPYSKY